MAREFFSIPLVILLFWNGQSQSRLIGETPSLPVSDGIQSLSQSFYLYLDRPISTEHACQQTYGFLPCTTTVLGNVFLVGVYEYVMYIGANYISTGCELLLQVLGPGIVGGLFLPVLVSGISGSKEAAQHQVSIGMGLLAGSIVVLLTLLWGTCIVVGASDYPSSVSLAQRKQFFLTGSGVTTDVWTSYAARIMVLSVTPFIIVQLPSLFNLPSQRETAILTAFIASAAFLLFYCLFQVFRPWIQRRRLAYVKHTHIISGILRHLQKDALGRLLAEDGQPNIPELKKLFHRLDLDSSGLLSVSELTALMIGIEFEVIDLDADDAVKKIMDELDLSGDSQIDESEFINGITKWLVQAKRVVPKSRKNTREFVHDFHRKTKEEHETLVADRSDEAVEAVDNPSWICFKAVLLLLLGTSISVAFADPLVHAVNDFSTATSMPPFFVSFLLLPLVNNTGKAISAIKFASQKKQRSSSLTLSEVYGAVTMKNTLSLAVFLAIVYVRGLKWTFSSEMLISLIVCVVVGLFASFRTKLPLWTSLAAFALYPSSLLLVYALDYLLGWS
ncbi:hypothetical protein ACLOJK_039637 [Asimina triloba]